MTKKLQDLHEKLCEVLLEKINNPDVTASELNVARQLLKDNGIDCVPVEGSPLQSLIDELPFKINDRNTKQAN
jgi:hypothetical protein